MSEEAALYNTVHSERLLVTAHIPLSLNIAHREALTAAVLIAFNSQLTEMSTQACIKTNLVCYITAEHEVGESIHLVAQANPTYHTACQKKLQKHFRDLCGCVITKLTIM